MALNGQSKNLQTNMKYEIQYNPLKFSFTNDN